MKSDLTILLNACGNESFEGVCEGLRLNGERRIKIIGTDIISDAHGLYLADKSYLVPSLDDPAHWNVLKEICRREGVNVIYPQGETAQEYFTEHARQFEIPVLAQKKEPLLLAVNKYLLCDYCAANGIPAPRVKKVGNWSDIIKAAEVVGFPETPFVLKLDRGVGAKGLRIVHRHLDPMSRYTSKENKDVALEELEFHLKKLPNWPEMHVVEYLPGSEYSADVLCLDGKVYSVVVRKRYSAIGGSSKFAEVVWEKDIDEWSRKLASLLKLNYVVNLQWRRDAGGAPKIMEINPRIPATIHQTIRAGVNMPYLAVKLALGEAIEVPEPKLGVCVMKYFGSIFIDKKDLKKRDL